MTVTTIRVQMVSRTTMMATVKLLQMVVPGSRGYFFFVGEVI